MTYDIATIEALRDAIWNADCLQCRDEAQQKIDSLHSGVFPAYQMIVCRACSNKRCPKATNHRLDCSNSNEPGQRGSAYPKFDPKKFDG